MNAFAQTTWRPAFLAVLAAGLLAAAMGAGFAMWVDRGAPLLRALAESRMGWCF